MSERRAPKAGPPPKFNVPPGDLGTLHRWSENLSRWLARLERDLVDGHSGLPATHGSGHDADGDDPLSTPGTPTTITPDTTADAGDGPAYAYEDHEHGITCAAPSNATGTAAAEGSASTFMRSDATILQGIVTTKGDVLSYSNVPDRLAVGADNTFLVAASGQTTGLQWQTLKSRLDTDYGLNAKGEILGHDGTDPKAITAPSGNGGGYPQVLVAEDSGTCGVAWYYPWKGFNVTSALTDNVSADLCYTDVTDIRSFWMRLRFNIVAYNGSDLQLRTGILNVRGYRTGGGAPTINAGDPLESETYSYNSTGTLTVTWATATTAGGRVTLSVTADTDLATPTLSITFQLEQVDNNSVSVLSFTP